MIFSLLLFAVAASFGKADEVLGPTSPPTPSPTFFQPECYTNLTLLAEHVVQKDPNLPMTFNLCPNMVFNVGFVEAGICCVDGQSPILPRSNMRVLCGADGDPMNNCTLVGGEFHLISAYTNYFEQPLYNSEIHGVTFHEANYAAALLSNGGDILFRDCVFKDHGGLGTIISFYSSPPGGIPNDNRRRRLTEGVVRGMDLWERLGFIMKEHKNYLHGTEDIVSLAVEADTNHGKKKAAQRELEDFGEWSRQKVLFQRCEFFGNKQGSRGEDEKYGIITIEAPYDDMEFRDCYFHDNKFGNPLDARGYAVYVTDGSTLSLSGNCFTNNNFVGEGVIIMESAYGLLLDENNFVTQDDGLQCEYIAEQPRDGGLPQCFGTPVDECSIEGAVVTEPSEPECYTNLTLLAEDVVQKDPFLPMTYSLCPNTVFNIGFEADPGSICCKDGQSPILPRSNMMVVCGDDGDPTNNCTLVGGEFQLISGFTNYFEQITNFEVVGVTFSNAGYAAALLANGGDIAFKDCLFKDNSGASPVLSFHSPPGDGGRRLLWDQAKMKDLQVWERMKLTMEVYQKYSAGGAITSIVAGTIGEETKVFEKRHGQRVLEEIEWRRQQVLFEGCGFFGNKQGRGDGEEQYGIITINAPYDDMEFKECYFHDNEYGDPRDARGYAVYVPDGSTLSLSGNCFTNNNFVGEGVIIMESADSLLLDENNFVTQDDGLLCEYIAEQPRDGGSPQCLGTPVDECSIEGVVVTGPPSFVLSTVPALLPSALPSFSPSQYPSTFLPVSPSSYPSTFPSFSPSASPSSSPSLPLRSSASPTMSPIVSTDSPVETSGTATPVVVSSAPSAVVSEPLIWLVILLSTLMFCRSFL